MRNKLFNTMVEDGKTFVLDYYNYAVTFSAVAAAASSPGSINIEADSDFVWQRLAFFAEIGGAIQTEDSRVLPLCTLAINDSGSGRNLQSEAIYLPAIAGAGGLPFVLPMPRIFRANSTISLTLYNASASQTYANVQLVFIGHKKFQMGSM